MFTRRIKGIFIELINLYYPLHFQPFLNQRLSACPFY